MRSLTRVGIYEPPSATTVFLRAPSVFFNLVFKIRMTEISNLMATAPEPPPRPVFKEPRPVNPNSLPFFNRIVEDIIVNAFGRLEEDPRDLARLACVCRRFRNLIKSSCYKRHCMRVVPCIVSELMQSTSQQDDVLLEPPGGWESLQKVLVCCPGLSHAGVLLNCYDYGLEREIGLSDDFALVRRDDLPKSGMEAKDVSDDTGAVNNTSDLNIKDKSSEPLETQSEKSTVMKPEDSSRSYPHREHTTIEHYQCGTSGKRRFDSACTRQLFDDANADDARTSSSGKKELLMGGDGPIKLLKTDDLHYHGKVMKEPKFIVSYRRLEREEERGAGSQSPRIRSLESKERSGNSGGGRRSTHIERRINHGEEPHLAKGVWTLRREQGNKLLASRFRSDSLFICDWPGCMHQGERRMYKLFRGIFKDFQHSHVFRNLKDLRVKKTEIQCAFCSGKTYDMVTSFCLRRSYEYHDDGEPVVRAYVCEDGHVAGAWTDRPLYNNL